MRERKRRWRIFVGLVLSAVMVGLYVLSPRLLYEDSAREQAEAIIILGGDAEGRVWRGLELYKGGVAPRILVSGAGEGRIPRRRLELAGVDPGVIFELILVSPGQGMGVEGVVEFVSDTGRA